VAETMHLLSRSELSGQRLRINFEDDGAHPATVGIFPVRLLDFFKPEGSLDERRDLSRSKPVE
jgi:hypothetical protein